MGTLDLLNHLLNFVAPALAVGFLLAVLPAVFSRKSGSGRVVMAQAAINSIAGVVVLGLGLWFFGRDAKMATYLAMVVTSATAQWFGTRR